MLETYQSAGRSSLGRRSYQMIARGSLNGRQPGCAGGSEGGADRTTR
jgi:hypothetical protein